MYAVFPFDTLNVDKMYPFKWEYQYKAQKYIDLSQSLIFAQLCANKSWTIHLSQIVIDFEGVRKCPKSYLNALSTYSVLE